VSSGDRVSRWARQRGVRTGGREDAGLGARDDSGSVLLLGVVAVAIGLLAIVVGVDSSAVFLQRRALVSLADAGALAGAQAIDLDTYYRDGAAAVTGLDQRTVATRVRSFLAQTDAVEIEGLRIERVESDGSHVEIVLSAPIRVPFLAALADERITVASRARLSYREVS